MSVQLELFLRLLKAASITAVEYIASFASQIRESFLKLNLFITLLKKLLIDSIPYPSNIKELL